MTCCPPGSIPYLEPDYAVRGDKSVTTDGLVEFYGIGDDLEKATIIFNEPFGWNSGRVRVLADTLALAGYFIVVPRLFGADLDEGSDGDGFSPLTPVADVLATLAKFDFTYTNAKYRSLLEHLSFKGFTKIVGLCFCWGAWTAAHVLATDWGHDILMGCVGAHPSIDAEHRIYKRDTQLLFDKITVPFCFLVARNDYDEYREGGAWFESLRTRHPASETHNFDTVDHGWMPRGDINDPIVKLAVDDGVAKTLAFFDKILR